MLERVARLAAAAAAALLAVAAVLYGLCAASLPRTGGTAEVADLGAPVRIELDRHAIPRVRAESLADAFRAQGFLHAQQRFFQMDLGRRTAAGKLAALAGARALPLDRAQRAFELERRAHELLRRWPAQHREWLEAYAAGVNAGLADLGARPPEYWLFGVAPEPWTAADSVLVLLAFYTLLSNNEAYELPQGVMHATLPRAVYDFLTPSTTRFDRPLLAPAADPTGGYEPAPVPPADVLDLRGTPLPPGAELRVNPPETGPASNQWAVDATRGAGRVALLANDPHLDLRLPPAFYRLELQWPGGLARGVSVPGLPGIVIGANNDLAWGATVSNADQSDWVVVEVDPADPERYLTPDGSEPFIVTTHTIEVAGGPADRSETRATRWGPIVREDWLGRPLALRATWLEPSGADLDLLAMMTAHDVDGALRVTAEWSGPSLSWALADSGGRIAWTMNGPLPRRRGFDGSRPMPWSRGEVGWAGVHDPPVSFGDRAGVVLNANNRGVPEPEASAFSRVWMRPLRAKRIDDLLRSAAPFDEQALLAMQLDTRVEAYDMLRDVILEVVSPSESEPLLARARAHAAGWNGNADVDQAGFRVLQLYYRALLGRVLAPLLLPAIAADPAFVYRWPLADEPLRRLLEERPAHLLAGPFADWPEFLRAVLRDALAEVERDPARPGIDAPWGEVNRLEVGHLFADLPLVGAWLRLPDEPLPGSTVSVRRASPRYGAVFRMVIAPARPEAAILQMSGGQSGHFLSRHFKDMHDDWMSGTPAPFLAGATVGEILLVPPQPEP